MNKHILILLAVVLLVLTLVACEATPTSTTAPASAPTVTPTSTNTATPAPTNTATPTPTGTATPTPTGTATPTPTPTLEHFTITGKILNNGQPVVNKYLYIQDSCDGSYPIEDLAETYTDNEGTFSFSLEYEPRYSWGSSCLLIQHNGYLMGETYSNAFYDWHCQIHDIDSGYIVIPDFDISYDGFIITPPDGFTIDADDISATNPLVFEWDPGSRSDITHYAFQLWAKPGAEELIWGRTTKSPVVAFNGIMSDGRKITPGTYVWNYWCHFSEDRVYYSNREFYANSGSMRYIINIE